LTIVTTATFVGYLVHGFLGAIVATVAIFLPSFLILLGVAPYFDRLRASPWFAMAIGGILCSFVGLLLTVTIRFALNVHWDFPHMDRFIIDISTAFLNALKAYSDLTSFRQVRCGCVTSPKKPGRILFR
jgi:chromate transport protein ChrA